MIFIKVDTNNRVNYINGDSETLGKTEEELLTIGYLVDKLPIAETPTGKDAILYRNPVSGDLYYEYLDRPLTANEEIFELKSQNAQMILALIMGGLM
jgi:hypothetical protein